MSKKRSNKISTIGSKVTTVISVALVLLIVGIIFIITYLTSGAGDALRENVAVVVRVADGMGPDDIQALSRYLDSSDFTASVVYNSPEDILKQEVDDPDEIIGLLGENPYSPEFEIYLKSQYVDRDSIARITSELVRYREVDEVYSQIDVINNVNAFLRQASLVLSAVALVFLVISVVLLVNTISLVIYSRRFVIHTMQLVGATAAFVRRPFVNMGLKLGCLSALVATVMICAGYAYMMQSQVHSMFFIGWLPTVAVCLSLFLLGMLICGGASYFAANRFVNSSYDDLFK